jgi:hypothetical protein
MVRTLNYLCDRVLIPFGLVAASECTMLQNVSIKIDEEFSDVIKLGNLSKT